MKNKPAILYVFLANAISGISQGMMMIAITWYINNTIDQPVLYNALFLGSSILSIVWGPYAGSLIDRYDRRKVMITINVLGGIYMMVCAATALVFDDVPIFLVCGIFIMTVVFYNVHFPNLYAFLQEIVPPASYGKITSAVEIQNQLAFVLSGGLAAVLLEGVPVHVLEALRMQQYAHIMAEPIALEKLIFIDGCTYLVSVLLLWKMSYVSLTERDKRSIPVIKRLQDGLTFLKERPLIFVFGYFSHIFFASIMVCSFLILPSYIRHIVEGDAAIFGLSEGLFALGAIFAGILVDRVFRKNRLFGIILFLLLGATIYAALFFSQSAIVLLVMYLFLGMMNASTRILRTTTLFQLVPNKIIGRTNSFFGVLNTATRILFIVIVSQFTFFSDNPDRSMGFLMMMLLLAAIVLGLNYKKIQDFKKKTTFD